MTPGSTPARGLAGEFRGAGGLDRAVWVYAHRDTIAAALELAAVVEEFDRCKCTPDRTVGGCRPYAVLDAEEEAALAAFRAARMREGGE